MSSPIDIIKAANKKESRRVKIDLPVDEHVVTFYVAAKDTYKIWSDQRSRYWEERKLLDGQISDQKAADTVAANVTASALMREIIPRYFLDEDGNKAWDDEEELAEIIDLISSDGAALNAVSEAWVSLTNMVTTSGEAAKNL